MRALKRCLIAGLLWLGACTTRPESTVTVPTLAVLPSVTPALKPTFTPTQASIAATAARTATSTAASTATATLSPVPAETSFPALVGNINVTSAPGIILRRDPSVTAAMIAVLPGGSVVRAQGRSADGRWIEVVSDQGIAGWVEARDVYALAELSILPTIGLMASATPSATVIPLATRLTLGDIPAMERRLESTPILENMATDSVHAIFRLGQGAGKRADVFTTIGDSNTTNGDFLQPIGMGEDVYCNWGDYDYLRQTVAFFSTAPTAEESNSFTHHSVTARKGFSSAAVLDPFWATGGVCLPGESPLLCEYRGVQPSVAIIMLGGIDVNDLTTADYDANMRTMVQTSIQQGVIPVLTTFVVLPDRDLYERSLEFNMMLLDIADEQQIPLINLWAAAQPLPDEGIGPDHTHLKAAIGSFCAFDGGQAQYGGTLRNLLTLQALDGLRRNVLAQ